MAFAGALDHVGVGVPDLAAAKAWYDAFVPFVGLTAWFPDDEHQVNYGPDGARGTQLFLYRATSEEPYSRHATGLSHLAFSVPDRDAVRAVHAWALERDVEVVQAPRELPEYGEGTFATYVLDPHGILLEVVSHD